MLGGRLGGVSPRRNCTPLGYPTRWSDRIVQSDHGESTTDDPTPPVGRPFQAARRQNPTPIRHSKTLTWSLHSPASSPVTSSRRHPITPRPASSPVTSGPAPPLSFPKPHPSSVIPRPFLRLSHYGHTPSGKSAPPLPLLSPPRFLLTPPLHARPYLLLDARSTASRLRLRPRPRPRL